MHRNYYIFEKQVADLNKTLIHAQIVRCFSHRKNELVLEISGNHQSLLRIGIDTRMPYILLYEPQNIREPKISLFEELNSQIIGGFEITPFDKTVRLNATHHTVEMRFYGKSANIVLVRLRWKRMLSAIGLNLN